MTKEIEQQLKILLETECQEKLLKIEPLSAHGSERKYFRLYTPRQNYIGTHNRDKAENAAFLSFSKHFQKLSLPVPKIYAEDAVHDIYLQQDLGDLTLFDYLNTVRKEEGFSKKIISVYEQVLQILPRFQITAAKDLDYNYCYPRQSFDKQSMMWDLNYFKYYFLKLAQISFNEQKLEDDFRHFSDFLLSAKRDYFMYRDFQSRNILLLHEHPYFIDYQGGRRGALQYDIASLLYDAKADIPPEIRDNLLDIYISILSRYISVNRESFITYYYGYVLIRIMQALGAYGFRGFYERKEQFLKSVPFALNNLEYLLRSVTLPLALPALTDAWHKLIDSNFLRQLNNIRLRLKVRIQSFSYKRGIPWDEKGHGGGFVLDCRALPNPGKYTEYSDVNGNDAKVVDYFKNMKEVQIFLDHTYQLIDQTVINYQQRDFTDLLVAFGCTGGQHRSVYCANQLAHHLKSKYDIEVEVRHLELETK
jgi:aminoglycoside/choline kinase family phosphotransferase